jgi:23S rRNA pseudouridine1911/1915/1917 synthase
MKAGPLPFEAGDRFPCGPEHAGMRLDLFLGSLAPDVSRSRIQKWLEQGCFSWNGAPARKNQSLAEGDFVDVVRAPEREDLTLKPEDLPLPIVFEDDHLLVIDKPKGMVTHPGNGIYTGTLANALAHRFRDLSDVNGPLRPGIVHRLDKDTSGLLLVAKDNAAHLHLARQLEAREIHRVYHALVWREMSEGEGTVDKPIARNPRDPLKMGIHAGGRRAVTHWKVLGYHQFASYLEVKLETGRTHQIRVHLSHLGHPVVGDPLYGGRESALARIQPLLQPLAARLLSWFDSQALHAHRLAFRHPFTDEPMEFESPLPAAMLEALAFLEKYRHG